MLPQYRIESLLGHGGMGAVYKGSQATLDRPVAIKLLPAKLAADGDFLARFQREARTLAQLQHPGIVAVYDFGQTSEGHLYFVMEYVHGTDLSRVLRGPGLNPKQALAITGQICDALAFAHSQGVIHRDIKPANILLTKDGRAKLADFGLARPAAGPADSLTETDVIMGTPDYMAPEQHAGEADARADIYALGEMLYEMLTGQRPQGIFALPSQRVQVDARIDEVVIKALQQEPALRYQRVSEMKTDVDRIRNTPPGGTRPVVPRAPSGEGGAPPTTPARKSRDTTRRVPPALVALLATVLITGLAFAWWKNTRPAQIVALAENPDAAASGAADSRLPLEPTAPEAHKSVAGAGPPVPAPPPPPGQPGVSSSASPAASTTATPVAPATPAIALLPIARTPLPLAATLPPATPTEPAPSLLPTFSRQLPNISAWVLAPLDQSVPADIRQNLMFLREDLVDESKRKPSASADAYRLGTQLCQTLLAILDDRIQTQARAGFRGVEAATRTGITSQALEARRNYLMSWPQYDREQSQRAELKSQAINNAAVLAERPKLDWSKRTIQLGKMIDTLYAQFRAAQRQSPPAK